MGQIKERIASASWYPVADSRSGLIEVCYGGIVCQESLMSLRGQLIDAFKHTPSIVIRADRAVMVMDEIPPLGPDAETETHAAVVVPAECRDLWVEYARGLAQRGVIRAVFSTEQADLAYRWAERRLELVRGL